MLREADTGFVSLQERHISEHLSPGPLLSPTVTALSQTVFTVAALCPILRKKQSPESLYCGFVHMQHVV